jgi:hypothetical protein
MRANKVKIFSIETALRANKKGGTDKTDSASKVAAGR